MIKAMNWNNVDELSALLWNQNSRQFWLDTEIPLSDDKLTWATMSADEQMVYKRILGGLTLLDTNQGAIGIPAISHHCNNIYEKAILAFMSNMEFIHAKSYSSIFTTLCTSDEIDEIFNWIDSNRYLVEKVKILVDVYNNISKYGIAVAAATSVLLESFLFYSGFFYPLYLSGTGKLTNSNEIINLIIRDESIHGIYIGQLFQKYNLNSNENKCIISIFENLYKLELEYSHYLYERVNHTVEAVKFIQYNANKAFMNLGLTVPFPEITAGDVNPIVLKGLDTSTKTHDFFSKKGNGYVKTTKVEKITDEDFFS